ncbi:hypothetical protein [Nocardiopsis ganjiahuensis]|uniref:hypothetical protein n=1 Tax=Nocardiopsis ganjiahuensis TaxID=239984 RepID=UPI001EF9FA7E|nr:hypothetical protein [Nocardiopsis ganjiahuensis]
MPLTPDPSSPGFAELRRRLLTLGAVALFAVFATLFAAAPAAWADPGAGATEAYESSPTPAEYYAEELAERPEGAAVFVDEVMAGQYDVAELEEELHELFSTLDVPYHVIVSPFPGPQEEWGGASVLAPVVDRLGQDGLYVHLRPDTYTQEAQVRGYDLPAADSVRALYDDPRIEHRTPVDTVAAVLVERLQGAAPVVEPDGSGAEGSEAEPGTLAAFWEGFLEETDPASSMGAENLGTLSGLAGGFLIASAGFWIWWRLHEGRAAAFEVPVVIVTGLALAGLSVAGPYALTVNAAEEDGAEIARDPAEARFEPPYVTGTDRVERLIAETESAPLYVGPLVPMDRTGLAATAERLEESELPVRAVVVPMAGNDESAGDPEVLAYALAELTGEEAVYLVATVGTGGQVGVAAGSAGLGIDPFDLSRTLWDISEATPAEAIEAALPALAEVPTDPGRADAEPLFTDDYAHEPGSPSERFFGDGFLPCLLAVGPLLSGILFGIALVVVSVVRAVRKGTGGRRPRMSTRALRRLALAETRSMVRELEEVQDALVPEWAMRDADASLVVLRRPVDALDLLGVTVLARRARAAIAGNAVHGTRAVCSADPLHGQARRTGRVHRLPGRRPLCDSCFDLSDKERDSRVLEVRIDGAWVPHLDLDRVWVRTNYGSTGRALVDGILEKSDA